MARSPFAATTKRLCAFLVRLVSRAPYGRMTLHLNRARLALHGARPPPQPDLARVAPGRCPACACEGASRLWAVPYYKTHLVHWDSTLPVYRKVVPPKYWLATFELRRCAGCGLVFVPETHRGLVETVEDHPLFRGSVVEPYLRQMQFRIDPDSASRILGSPLEELGPVEGSYRRLHQIIAGYRAEISSYLDLGSNMGAFAELIRLSFPSTHVTGCEINPHYAARCRANYPHLRVIDARLTPDSGAPPQDFIYCSDVIEHVWDLEELFRTFRSHLRDGGLLMLVTPNVDSAPARAQGLWWWSYIVPHHCQAFAFTSVKALLDRFGFTLLQHGEIGEELFVVCRKAACAEARPP
jgi:SAM-dependent methyltransferase